MSKAYTKNNEYSKESRVKTNVTDTREPYAHRGAIFLQHKLSFYYRNTGIMKWWQE